MAIVRFNLNSGANIHSTKTSSWLDTVKDLQLDDGEWESMKEDKRMELVNDWANNYIEIYYEEK